MGLLGSKRRFTSPLRLMRNLVKFHWMSPGRLLFSHTYRGEALAPFTSILANWGKVMP